MRNKKKKNALAVGVCKILHQMITKSWCTLTDPGGAHVVLTLQPYRQFQKSLKEVSTGCENFSTGNHSVDGKFSAAWCSASAFLF